MAKCEVCDKGIHFGQQVSHSHRKTNKQWKPNIRKIKANVNGQAKSMYVCSKCLRAGKIERV
jgi:large subunit ribosomal protein L28